MPKPNIALVALCIFDDMGISTLRTVLKGAGYDVDVIYLKELRQSRQNYPSPEEIKLVVDILKARKRELIGISVKSSYFKMAKILIASIRKALPESFIILGGAHPTLCPQDCISFADGLCIGEGEGAMLDLADSLRNGLSINRIPNLWIRQNDTIYKNDIRPLIEDLDSIPLPDLKKENIFYVDDNTIKSDLQLTLYTTLTSRGCPFDCAFCSTAALRKIYEGHGKYIRQRSVENVIAELKKVRENLPEINLIQFNDDVFGLNQGWVEKFCALYAQEIHLPFKIVIHPQYVTEELMQTLASTKLLKLAQVGIQSGSERIAKHYFNRYTPKSVILKAAKCFKKYKVSVNYHLILDNPFAIEDDNRQTLELMLSLPKPFTIVLYSLTYFPKTQLAELALKQGIIKEENIEGNADKCINQIHISPEYKRQPLEVFYVNLLYLTQIRFMPKFFVKFLSKAKTLKKYPRILEKFDFIVDKINRFFYQIIPLFYRGIGHLFCGRLNIAKLRSGIKSFEFIVGQKENF